MKPLLELSKPRNGVASLTIQRPQQRNALGGEGDADAFQKASHNVNSNPGIRCLILTGEGPSFCAGGNVRSIHKGQGPYSGAPSNISESYRIGVHRIVQAVWNIEIPVVAAVNGHALGLGMDLACLCDIRVAANNARMGSIFARLGLIPGDGGSWLLPRIVGLPRASDMIFTARILDAQTALLWNLVNEVVPLPQLIPHSKNLAKSIAAHPRNALKFAKRLIRQGMETSFLSAMDSAASHQSLLHKDPEHLRAVSALVKSIGSKGANKPKPRKNVAKTIAHKPSRSSSPSPSPTHSVASNIPEIAVKRSQLLLAKGVQTPEHRRSVLAALKRVVKDPQFRSLNIKVDQYWWLRLRGFPEAQIAQALNTSHASVHLACKRRAQQRFGSKQRKVPTDVDALRSLRPLFLSGHSASLIYNCPTLTAPLLLPRATARRPRKTPTSNQISPPSPSPTYPPPPVDAPSIPPQPSPSVASTPHPQSATPT